MFVTHTPNNGVSWKVTLCGKICIQPVLGLSEEIFLLRLPFPTFPLACYLGDSELNTLTTVYSSLDQSMSLAKAQGPRPNIQFWALLPTIFIFYKIMKNKLVTKRSGHTLGATIPCKTYILFCGITNYNMMWFRYELI